MIEGILAPLWLSFNKSTKVGPLLGVAVRVHCGPLGEAPAAAPGRLPALSDYELL